jgi:hypothetical protein
MKNPQDIQIQFVQDKVDLLDKFKIGESVKIGINLRGRGGLMQRRNSLFQSIQVGINKVESVNTNDLQQQTKF